MPRRFLSLLFAAFLTLPAVAQSKTAADAPVTHAELDALIHRYLTEHPEVIAEAAVALQKKADDRQQDVVRKFVQKHSDDLYAGADPTVGDTEHPDLTIVEFFDYYCSVCKTMFPTVDALVATAKEKHIRVVFKEFPIFGPASDEMARLSLAVYRAAPDKYFAYHSTLMKFDGHADQQTVDALLLKLGLDPVKVHTLSKDPSIQAVIDKNHAIGDALDIKGTPAVLIGDQMIPHLVSDEELQKAIDEQRANAAK